MNKKKFRDLSIVFFVGLFLMTKQIVFVWLLVFFVVAMSSSYSGSNGATRLKRYREDADEKDIEIPPSHSIHQKLERVYQRLADSKKRQPEIAQSFDELVNELWDNLAMAERQSDWKDLLDSLLEKWPQRRSSVRNNLETKIQNVQKLSDQWSDARAEAYGKKA